MATIGIFYNHKPLKRPLVNLQYSTFLPKDPFLYTNAWILLVWSSTCTKTYMYMWTLRTLELAEHCCLDQLVCLLCDFSFLTY